MKTPFFSAFVFWCACIGTDAGEKGRRKLPPLVGYGREPPSDRFPLQECEGDCDVDGDCDEGLVCFERGGPDSDRVWPAVPGCDGGATFNSPTDFCIVPPVESAEAVPMDDLSVLQIVRNDDITIPLGLCQGDCDSDDSCLDELICFQRGFEEEVPGCRGESLANFDYCVKPNNEVVEDVITLAPTEADTMPNNEVVEDVITLAPTEADVIVLSAVGDAITLAPTAADTMAETMAETYPRLQTLGDAIMTPLGLCQGDCDSDIDCLDSLICFQRNSSEPVPGCSGGGSRSYDYCIDPNATMEDPLATLDVVFSASVEAPTSAATVSLKKPATGHYVFESILTISQILTTFWNPFGCLFQLF